MRRSCFNKIEGNVGGGRDNLRSFRGYSGGIGSIRMQWGERISHAAPAKLLTPSSSSRILIDSSYQRDLFQSILTLARCYLVESIARVYIYTRVDSRLDSWNSGNLADTILPIFDPDRKKAGFRAGFHSRDSGLRDIEANRGNCFR